jgi:PPOX class probable F420-dependent enzyme
MLTPDQITFLERQRVARLATVDERGRPHVVPVCYALLDGVIYTPIDEKPKRAGTLRRVRNILAEPRVCLVVDHYEEDWGRLAWLQVHGRAALVEGPDERRRAIAALRQRYEQYRTMRLESRELIGLTPGRVRSWRATP